MRIYVLWHTHLLDPDDVETEDVKLLGLYSTEQKAFDRIEQSKTAPGFSEYPEGFLVDPYELDEDQWVEGFATVRWTDE
jgi:hypothetical protein